MSRPVAIAVAVGLAAFVHVAHGDALTTLAILAPALVAFLLLKLGRYPGERLLIRGGRKRQRRSPTARPLAHRPHRASLPRGGDLLASSMAGRAPPFGPWIATTT